MSDGIHTTNVWCGNCHYRIYEFVNKCVLCRQSERSFVQQRVLSASDLSEIISGYEPNGLREVPSPEDLLSGRSEGVSRMENSDGAIPELPRVTGVHFSEGVR